MNDANCALHRRPTQRTGFKQETAEGFTLRDEMASARRWSWESKRTRRACENTEPIRSERTNPTGTSLFCAG